MKLLFAVLVILGLPLAIATDARAALNRSELGEVFLAPPAHAAAPLALEFRDIQDKRVSLRDAIDGRPAVLLFVD